MQHKQHSITKRIIIGKIIGLIVGILFIAFMTQAGFSVWHPFNIGILLMFVLMGTLTGFMGIFDEHPVFKFKMPWWIRGALVGGFCMLVMILLAFDDFQTIMQSSLVAWTGLNSPFWAIIDGVFVGIFMEYVETKFAGEGKNLPVV